MPTSKEFVDNLPNSPYWKTAYEVLYRRGVDKPNIADILETMQEIACVDNKINQKNKGE